MAVTLLWIAMLALSILDGNAAVESTSTATERRLKGKGGKHGKDAKHAKGKDAKHAKGKGAKYANGSNGKYYNGYYSGHTHHIKGKDAKHAKGKDAKNTKGKDAKHVKGKDAKHVKGNNGKNNNGYYSDHAPHKHNYYEGPYNSNYYAYHTHDYYHSDYYNGGNYYENNPCKVHYNDDYYGGSNDYYGTSYYNHGYYEAPNHPQYLNGQTLVASYHDKTYGLDSDHDKTHGLGYYDANSHHHHGYDYYGTHHHDCEEPITNPPTTFNPTSSHTSFPTKEVCGHTGSVHCCNIDEISDEEDSVKGVVITFLQEITFTEGVSEKGESMKKLSAADANEILKKLSHVVVTEFEEMLDCSTDDDRRQLVSSNRDLLQDKRRRLAVLGVEAIPGSFVVQNGVCEQESTTGTCFPATGGFEIRITEDHDYKEFCKIIDILEELDLTQVADSLQEVKFISFVEPAELQDMCVDTDTPIVMNPPTKTIVNPLQAEKQLAQKSKKKWHSSLLLLIALILLLLMCFCAFLRRRRSNNDDDASFKPIPQSEPEPGFINVREDHTDVKKCVSARCDTCTETRKKPTFISLSDSRPMGSIRNRTERFFGSKKDDSLPEDLQLAPLKEDVEII